MTWTILRRPAACALAVLASFVVAGCGLLDASDPTAVEESDLANATGADLMRRTALGLMYVVFGDAAAQSGLLTDEFLVDPRPSDAQSGTISGDRALDQRLSERLEQAAGFTYQRWQEVRQSASTAMQQLRAYAPEEPGRAHIGQMLTVRGYATLALGEDFCPGFPLNEVVDGRLVIRPPLTTAAVYERALADLDSAVVYAADSARFADGARVGRARALLGLGRFAEAGAAATSVPTTYVWNVEQTTADGAYQPNPLAFTFGSARKSVADAEGGTGLNFVAANDPRVATTFLGTAYDGVTGIYGLAKYPDQEAPIVLVSGLEARLIEAEAALQSGGDWLGLLNQLRATQVSPALAPLADPGTDAARVDLLFRERAFWLFATGHRLGDMRRLIRQYERDSESVFPGGGYIKGGQYGPDVNLPLPQEVRNNPNSVGCLDRNA
jgi:starch-binding outer membrane protein, SusD/RagB family